MRHVIFICPADIRNRLYEAGIFKGQEEVVMIVGKCAVLERIGGSGYLYRAVNIDDFRSIHLYSRKTPIQRVMYYKMAERVAGLEINSLDGEYWSMEGKHRRARQLLSDIFEDILPRYGMSDRKDQKELSLLMLEALQEDKLALCEAEVGIGKTHAYILAVTVYNLFAEYRTPAIISTSTIALQEAITREYIPQISGILMEHRIIEAPLSFAVRKGKGHYVCDLRLRTYESSIHGLQRTEDKELLGQLGQLWMGNVLDLDGRPLTPYVKKRINVTDCSERCPYSGYCRYAAFSKGWLSSRYDFQIANHNYVLADARNRREGKVRLFPHYNTIVFDEAHKLMDAARQIYCARFSENEIPRLIRLLAPERWEDKHTRHLMTEMGIWMSNTNTELFQRAADELIAVDSQEASSGKTGISQGIRTRVKELQTVLCQLTGYLKKMAGNRYPRPLVHGINESEEKLGMYLTQKDSICWVEKSDNGVLELCSIPKGLEHLLYQDLWGKGTHDIITSGTMSVNGDFSLFKKRTGISYLQPQDRKVMEVTKGSPFNYLEHAMLYIPDDMPFPDIHDTSYLDAVSREIIRLVRATYGHTLILFSSYWLMERVFYETEPYLRPFPAFVMKRGRLDVIERYRRSRNGILFASDSAGEGIDLPGDILSSVIVVKLPFPVPDPVMEYERSKYADFQQYMKESIVPGMIIKLRQWIGRGIRRETDTTVFSILDSRAGKYGKYRGDIITALPDMPVTAHIEDVGRFIMEKKPEEYFYHA